MGTLQGGHMQMIFLPEAIIIIQHTEGRGILEKEVITPAITTEKIMIEIWIISLLLFPGFVYLMFRGRIIHIFNIEILDSNDTTMPPIQIHPQIKKVIKQPIHDIHQQRKRSKKINLPF